VRADKKQKGLLYAGTETGLYISTDDGANWQKLQLGLPIVPINDLIIHDNDLVAATAGRGFWILDDLGALQNMTTTKKSVQIFKPKDTYRLFGGSMDKFTPGLGQNPKQGVTFDYYLEKDPDSLELKLEVLEQGKVIRSYSNQKPKDFKSWPGGPSAPEILPSKKGFNRFTWDFQREALPAITQVFVFGGLNGSNVAPGDYTLKLTLEGESSETVVTILPNPNIKSTPQDFSEQQAMLATIESTVKDMHESVNKMRSAKSQLEHYAKLLKDNKDADSLLKIGKGLMKRITSWEENLIQPKQKTFQDVINFNNKLNAQLLFLKGSLDAADPKVTEGSKVRLQDLMKDWKVYQDERDAIINTEMNSYNEMYKTLNIPALILKD
jgi:hypothetical protein